MNQGLLSKINAPIDLASLSYTELINLASEIRQEILQVVGSNGGHLASNLGVIELTLALHRVFSTPNDEIVWDVGHQSYPHKLITGRFSKFTTLRLKDGISGFPKREESLHDSFNTGHASTSISAALGILEGKRLQNKMGKVIAVIGDGALTGGMVFEALSNAGELKKDLIIILNDNQMSIGKNTGALSRYLSRFTMHAGYQRFKYIFDSCIAMIPFVGSSLNNSIRLLKRGVKGVFYKNNVFADLGFEYVGPLDGHNIHSLEKVLKNVKKLTAPAVVHVKTIKGKGYSFAENNPAAFHGIGPFNLTDGSIEKDDSVTFTQAFAKTILSEAKRDNKVVAITAAMASGTGLEAFKHLFPKRFYDVGIAEEHAVTFAAGLAVTGIKAVVAVYSTFLQRAVDQVIHDVALQNLHVIFAADRAGAVPHDGETHQGLYDIALFRPIPNMTILCPASEKETELMFEYAFKQNSPVLIRYPKASCPKEKAAFSAPIENGRGIFLKYNKSNVILLACTGGIYAEVFEAANILAQKGIGTDIYNIRFAKPVDEDFFLSAVSKYSLIVFAEDGCKIGGVCEYLESIINMHTSIKTYTAAFPDVFLPHGSRYDILYRAGLAPEQIAEKTEKLLEKINVTYNLHKETINSSNFK